MSPLYLWKRVHRIPGKVSGRSVRALLAAVGVLSLASVAAARAQDEPEPKKPAAAKQDSADKQDNADPPIAPNAHAAGSVVNFHARPKVVSEAQRPRRTVQLDGKIGEGEWDLFYSVAEGPIKGSIYCNWDDNYLYLAARTDGAATLVFDIDASNDGWLRGADNLEVVVGSVTEGGQPSITARLLDASNSKETPAWADRSADAKQIQVAGKLENGGQVVEIAIPKSMGSLVMRPGANIGLRGEFMPSGDAGAYMPTAPFEPHLLLDATLVEARQLSASGINPNLTLSDKKCVPGQKLFATMELYNQTDAPMPIKAVQWGGTTGSVNAVNSVRRVAVPPVGPMRRLRLPYETLLPADLPPGTYTLQVTVDLDNGKQIQSSTSFTVVEPLQPQISTQPDPVTVVGPTTFAVVVDVYNANPGQMNCEVDLLTIPLGWELVDNKRTKLPLTVDKEDSHANRQFVFKLPSTTPAGDYPLDATVTWHKRVWKLHTIAHVLRPEPVVPKQP